jgi:hypothetical protein
MRGPSGKRRFGLQNTSPSSTKYFHERSRRFGGVCVWERMSNRELEIMYLNNNIDAIYTDVTSTDVTSRYESLRYIITCALAT